LTNGVEINDAKATTANTLAKNGVIHEWSKPIDRPGRG
jgi:uncharacterized surface protein with fasciclin (FAS1) repeats